MVPSVHPHRSFDASFAVLAAASDPPYADLLIGLEREFRAVAGDGVANEVDRLAGPLARLGALPAPERAGALAAAARAALPHEGRDPHSWLLSCALQQRRGSAALRAGLAAAIAHRAGLVARPVRLGGRWHVGVHDHGAPVTADVGRDFNAAAPDVLTGCLCAHELALAVLGGLAGAWRAEGDRARARRAAGLRLLLPLDELRRRNLLDDDGIL